KAHTYHTKVPPKAVSKLLKYYTQPGDIIYDGFAGSGMAGVASMFPEYPRNAITNDLSPIASFISHLYTNKIDPIKYRDRINKLIQDLESELGWMFKAGKNMNQDVRYFVWSDVYLCVECNQEIIFWDQAYDEETEKYKSEFQCPNCSAVNSKKKS